jgi:hypothetical protein
MAAAYQQAASLARWQRHCICAGSGKINMARHAAARHRASAGSGVKLKWRQHSASIRARIVALWLK